MNVDPEKLEVFMGKMIGHMTGSTLCYSIWLGDELGLYRELAGTGPRNADSVATKTGCNARLVREWLDAQAAGGLVAYDPAADTYELSPEAALALADDGSPVFVARAMNAIGSMFLDVQKVAAAFRGNGALAWGEHHPCLFCGTEWFFRTGYRAYLTTQWIPALDGVETKLKAGARVAPCDAMTAAVFYATREGHTRKIAERIAADLRTHGAHVDLFDVRSSVAPDWTTYSVACLAASVHIGHHEREMIAFAKRYRDVLSQLDAAFVSVTLSEAGAEDPARSDAERRAAAADAQRMIDVFIEETGWQPAHALPVAGALAYSRYNFLVRFLMKRIARKAGAPTDASRDYEFTDWPALDRFVDELAHRAG